MGVGFYKLYYWLMKAGAHIVDALMLLMSFKIVLNVQIPYLDGCLCKIISCVETISSYASWLISCV